MAYIHYTPMEGYQSYSGKNSFVYSVLDTEEWLDVFLKSRKHPCCCPACGQPSNRVLSTSHRTVQDLPFSGKPTLLHINMYKYHCTNPKCRQNVFNEILDYVATSQVRTDRANMLVLAAATFLSNDAASILLDKLELYISNDGVQRLVDSVTISELPDPAVSEFAKLEGIDLSAHRGAIYFTFNGRIHLISLIQRRDPVRILNRLQGERFHRSFSRELLDEYAKKISARMPSIEECQDPLTLFEKLVDIMETAFCGGIQECF